MTVDTRSTTATARTGLMRRLMRRILIGLMAVVLLAGSAYGLRVLQGNFGPVIEGSLYRSGQVGADRLAGWLEAHEIATVLNLRGYHPDLAWYRAESAATLGNGARQVDLALSSQEFLSRDQLTTLIEVLRDAPRPMLVHCQHGAERTSLVAAISELLRDGGSIASARRQYTPRFLFFPVKDGVVMKAHLDLYEAYLDDQGVDHSPERFLHWAHEVYVPPSPSREEWPYDPYPLIVVSTPDGRVEARYDPRARGQEIVSGPGLPDSWEARARAEGSTGPAVR